MLQNRQLVDRHQPECATALHFFVMMDVDQLNALAAGTGGETTDRGFVRGRFFCWIVDEWFDFEEKIGFGI